MVIDFHPLKPAQPQLAINLIPYFVFYDWIIWASLLALLWELWKMVLIVFKIKANELQTGSKYLPETSDQEL